MGVREKERTDGSRWNCVHQCSHCRHTIPLQEMNLKAITTGIVRCPSCHRSGQIEIKIVEQAEPTKQAP